MLSERNRQRWTRSRGLLRALLGRYLQQDPSTVFFLRGPHGKPALAGGGIFFNLSHSDNLVLYALRADRAVGVDVQSARPALDEAALARRFLAPAEAERLAHLDSASRPQEFLRAWVRHEATLKCHGTGIRLTPGEAAGDETPGSLWLADLDVGAGAAGAVACPAPAPRLRFWDW